MPKISDFPVEGIYILRDELGEAVIKVNADNAENAKQHVLEQLPKKAIRQVHFFDIIEV